MGDHFATIEHDEVSELLPWMINGSLSVKEQDKVKLHVKRCSECQKQLESLQAMQQSIAQDKQSWQATPAHFASILAEVDRMEMADKPIEAKNTESFLERIQHWLQKTPVPVRWTLAAESFALLAFLAIMMSPIQMFSLSKNGDFKTLSDTKTIPSTVDKVQMRVLLKDEGLKLSELVSLLRQAHAQIIDGPSDLGFFTIEIAKNEADSVMSLLAHHPGVRLAQFIE